MGNTKAKLLKNIGIAVVCICVLSYAVFHVSSLFSEEIGTIIVGPTEENTSVTLGGYVFRDSELVNSKYIGAVDYAVSDGEKVAVNDKLATVYSEGNLQSSRETLAILDEQIALLEKSVADKPSVSELTKLRQRATDAYYSLMKQLSSGNVSTVSADSVKLLSSINSVAMLSYEDFNIEQTLKELLSTRAQILAAGGESEDISAKRSGYFYSGVHGYEGSFSGRAARELGADELLGLFESPDFDEKSTQCIGKMSYDSTWYFVSDVKVSEADSFEEGRRYTVEFTGGGYFEVDMTLQRILLSSDQKSAVLVFETNIIPNEFGFEHRQTAKVVTKTISGIYVPMSAVKRENFTRVVYIISGSVVELRHIDIIYEGADYYIVSDDVESDEKIYLKSNDQLIVSGSNLFHGRILD